MKKTRRSSQVGDMVRSELASIIYRDMSDPELSLVTITDVEMTPDLRLARVFVSSLGDEAARDKAVVALQKAKGKLRHALSRRAALRVTPELEFRSDTTALRASAIEKILHDVLPAGSGQDESPETMDSEEAGKDDE